MPEEFEEPQESWVCLGPHDKYGDPYEVIPICDEPSPGGKMLCVLKRSHYQHYFKQHLGIDRHGNFRGWADKRSPN